MKLEAHIHNPHVRRVAAKSMQLALENYDAIGRWRTEEISRRDWRQSSGESLGQPPNRRAYKTPEEFKQLLLADLDTFNLTFIEKLTTYGLRRTRYRSMTVTNSTRLQRPAERKITASRSRRWLCPTYSRNDDRPQRE